jgi:predicted acylesterase/phospholipase RssA
MYTSVVIAGGALKVMSVIGVVQYLQEKDALSSIKNFVGTSAGAILCLLMSLGFTSQQMKKIVVDALSDETITKFDPDGILNILSTYGISSGDQLETLFNKLIYKKTFANTITFMELAKKTGKNLVVCVSNLTKEKPEFFCVDTTPHFSVAKAVRMSCTIPIMFQPVEVDDNLYVDGGLYNDFPIDYFPDSKLHDILGINIINKNYQKHDNFIQYVNFIFKSILSKHNMKPFTCVERNILTLEFDDDEWFSLFEISIKFTKEQLDEYIAMGYARCRDIKV